MQILLTPRLSVQFAVVVLLLLLLLVYQPDTGLRLLLVVATPLPVCQPGTGLCMLLAIVVLLLLPGCGGHAVQIVPLVVNGRKHVPGGDIHNKRNILQDVHEEL